LEKATDSSKDETIALIFWWPRASSTNSRWSIP